MSIYYYCIKKLIAEIKWIKFHSDIIVLYKKSKMLQALQLNLFNQPFETKVKLSSSQTLLSA